MQRKKFLSFFGFLAVLIILPVITTMLARNKFEIRISALEDDTPRNVIITDIRNNSFRVSWVTEKQVIGGVSLSDGNNFYEEDKARFHSVLINGLKLSTVYEFELLSGAKKFNSESGTKYRVRTSNISGSPDKYLVYGQVFSPDGYSFQQGGIISIELSYGVLKSQAISTKVNETGGFQFDLGGLLTNDLTQSFPYKVKSEAILKIYITHNEDPFEKHFPVDFLNNRQIPNIYLGEVNIDIIPGVGGD